MKSLTKYILATLSLSLLLAGCGGASTTISIADKGFVEQFVLAEMYAIMLEDAGFKVDRKGTVGGTPAAHEAMLNDELDIYPEYTGTGLLTVLQMDVMSDPTAVYDTVAQEYADQFSIAWLAPAPMNNTQALAMHEAVAAEFGITTFSDLAAQASHFTLAGPPEFAEREDGLPGLQEMYGGYEFANFLAVDFGLRYPTLLSGDADVVVAFGTDGEIFANGLRLLKDDQGLYPPYQVAPVVRQAVLDENPEIATVLDKLAPLLTDSVMQELNNRVSGGGEEPADVARDFLLSNDLISE